ncbi:MAG: amino acid transporter [Trebouxia sp. A1-2]|nr:MAG: amino acid transporter [Trebouxia sp. A1-2]
MSELSSAFPVSGGLYYWSFMLGGNHGPLASWMVGWINLLGQVALVAGTTFTVVEIFAGVVFLATRDDNNNGYWPSSEMQLYLYMGLLVINATINSAPLKVLVRIARIGAIWQILAASWPLMGYDAVAHMIEETKSADTTAGKPMPYTLLACFAVGMVYLLALTLCIQNVDSITDPASSLAEMNGVALIFWDIFEAKYESGKGAVFLLLIPLGCGCCMAFPEIGLCPIGGFGSRWTTMEYLFVQAQMPSNVSSSIAHLWPLPSLCPSNQLPDVVGA